MPVDWSSGHQRAVLVDQRLVDAAADEDPLADGVGCVAEAVHELDDGVEERAARGSVPMSVKANEPDCSSSGRRTRVAARRRERRDRAEARAHQAAGLRLRRRAGSRSELRHELLGEEPRVRLVVGVLAQAVRGER